MTEDKDGEIVAEVRAIRDAHARQFNYDADAIFDDLLKTQENLKKQGYRFASLGAKHVPKKTGTNPR